MKQDYLFRLQWGHKTKPFMVGQDMTWQYKFRIGILKWISL